MGQDSVDTLVSRLKGADREDRKAAATALRRLGPKAVAAVPALIEAMGDPDQSIRYYAANCLGHIGSQAREAIPALARILGDKDESEHVRTEAAWSLGQIGPDALDALVEALRPGQDVVARRSAANAIGKMGPKAEPAIPHLIEALAEEEYRIWHNAGESLIAIGSAAVPPLRCAVESHDPRVRVHAGRTLLKLEPGHLPTIRAMIEDLKHPDVQVRVDAVIALGSASRDAATETVPAFADSLKDDDSFVRHNAALNLFRNRFGGSDRRPLAHRGVAGHSVRGPRLLRDCPRQVWSGVRGRGGVDTTNK